MGLINQLNATTEYCWLNGKDADPVDIVNKASALLWKLMGNAQLKDNWEIKPHELVDGGLMIKVPLEYAASNSGGYSAQTVINQSKKDIIDAARFGWAGVYGSNTLNLDDLTQNSGDEAIISLTMKYIKSIIKAARTQMAGDVIALASTGLSADGAVHINGLLDLFCTNTSTAYGAITEAAMSDWKANVITTAEAISFEVMQKIFRTPAMGDIKEMKPNFCVTTDKLRDGYERSLHPQQRYANTTMVEAGWDNVTHKGAPIVGDNYITTSYDGYLMALNLNFLELRSHKDFNFTTPVWKDKSVLGQPDVLTADTRWRGNLLCTNRKMHVMHTNLTEPT